MTFGMRSFDMRRILIAYLALCAVIGAAYAYLPATGAGQGGPSAATYTGPIDLFAFNGWWGLRAGSSAKRGTAFANICNVSDVVCSDVSSDATTGKPPATITIGGSDCSSVTCTIKKLYDQVSTGDATQNTISQRPTLVMNCTGLGASLPCMACDHTAIRALNTGAVTYVFSAPYTFVSTVKRTGGASTQISIGIDAGATDSAIAHGGGGSANTVGIVQNSFLGLTATATDGAWNSVVGAANGASSAINVNGSDTTGATGGSTGTDSSLSLCAGSVTVLSLDGFMTEGGFASGQPANASARSALGNNSKTFWGF